MPSASCSATAGYSEPGWEHRYGDSPRLRLQLNVEFADGSTSAVASGAGWKAAAGPIVRNDLYGGETYDARREQPGWASTGFDDAHWDAAVDKDAPGGTMVAQVMPPIRVQQNLQPVHVSQPKDGVHVFELGQLFGGWARLRLKGARGTKVTIKYACQLLEDSGLVDQESGEFYSRHRSRHSAHEEGDEIDIYILKGDPDGESYEPRFTYHPVRYVQVESDGPISIEELEGRVVFSDVDLSGGFECSNPIFNRIHELVHWTVTNGLFGIPLDCLHREHWAWTDPATVASSIYPRKHMPRFWSKWLDDIKDAQYDDGRVPDICPNYVQREDPDPAWGANYPILVWYLFQYFDDNRILQEHYAAIRLWADYLTSVAEHHIVNEGHYGDHMLPGAAPGEEEFVSSETPPPLLWTGYYYLSAAIVSKVADHLGKEDDAAQYGQLAEAIKDALNREWLDPVAHRYASGSQTANLFPLALGIVPQANEAGVVQGHCPQHRRGMERPSPHRQHRHHLPDRHPDPVWTGGRALRPGRHPQLPRLGLHGRAGRHHHLGILEPAEHGWLGREYDHVGVDRRVFLQRPGRHQRPRLPRTRNHDARLSRDPDRAAPARRPGTRRRHHQDGTRRHLLPLAARRPVNLARGHDPGQQPRPRQRADAGAERYCSQRRRPRHLAGRRPCWRPRRGHVRRCPRRLRRHRGRLRQLSLRIDRISASGLKRWLVAGH